MSDVSNVETVSKGRKAESSPAPLFAGVPAGPDYFLGRDDLLHTVIDCLAEGHDIALWTGGLPGIGATALAATIAHHPKLHTLFPDGVLWASCGDEQEALSGLSAWANVLGVDLSKCSDAATKSLVLHNTIADRRILLVIDSPGFDEAVLLRCGGAHCAHLLTTRDETLARDFATPENLVTVPPLSGDVALELLRALAPQVAVDEPELLAQVAHLTAGIPLVIHLLGAFLAAPEPCAVENLIVAPRFSATGPAIEFGSSRRRLMLAMQRLGEGEATSATVQRAVALSVAALPNAALHAFRCLGAFAAAPHTFNSAAVQSVCQCDAQTVALLVRRHLLEVSSAYPAALVGHSPMRRRTRVTHSAETEMDDQARLTIRSLIGGISQIRSDAQAPERHRDYYLAQARECRDHGVDVDAEYGQIRHASAALPDSPAVLEFAWAMQYYHARRNMGHEQAAWMQRAQGQTAAAPGPGVLAQGQALPAGPLPLANLLEQIGAAYRAQNQPQQAINYYRRALNLRELLPDPSDQFALGHTLHQLGLSYYQSGQPQQAISILQSALPALDGKEAHDLPGMAQVLTELGTFSNETGQHVQAVNYLQRSLAIYDDPASAQGLSTAGLVNTLGQLGKSCMKLGRYSQARTHLQRALENRQRAIPGDVAGMADVSCDLGECCTLLGQHDDALAHLQRAQALHEQTGAKHGAARATGALGALYQVLNRPDQALAAYQRSLPLSEEVGDQALLAQACTGIGMALSSKGRRDEALSYLQRAQSLLEPAAEGKETALATAMGDGVPSQDARLAGVLNHMGSIYLDRNEPARALDYLKRALQLREKAVPGDQSAVAQTLNNLGAAYSKLNQPEQALECLNRTLTIHAELGDSAGESAARCNMAMLCLLQGQPDQAVSNMKRAVELDREINSPDLAGHQALLRRFEAEYIPPPAPARQPESKPSFLGRLRKRE
jgi:tetratricopeptide (TPR) repeat protein